MARERRTKLYPAQIRYQQRNPMVSFRIPKDEYDHLKETSRNSGVSLAQMVRKKLKETSNAKDGYKKGYEDGVQSAKRNCEKRVREAHKKGYDDGVKAANKKNRKSVEKALKEGYETAKSRFEITYPCSVCGEMATMFPNQNDHKRMMELMEKDGWKHSKCEE